MEFLRRLLAGEISEKRTGFLGWPTKDTRLVPIDVWQAAYAPPELR
ncbi:hypothetical protein [Salinactinospora qingdaonensis]|uniref:Uncharacterized protein n=1 Tax=Salinactinospora qingdaonensis TaxID=702744 RepID=A0ABP7FLC6_9ACTN